MNEEIARKLVLFIAKHSERQTALLHPDPKWIMYDPHELLRIIEESGIPAHQIDTWCQDAGKE